MESTHHAFQNSTSQKNLFLSELCINIQLITLVTSKSNFNGNFWANEKIGYCWEKNMLSLFPPPN